MPIELRPGRASIPNTETTGETRAPTTAAPTTATSETRAPTAAPTALDPQAPLAAHLPPERLRAVPSAMANAFGLTDIVGDVIRRFRAPVTAAVLGAMTLPGLLGPSVAEAQTVGRREPPRSTARVEAPVPRAPANAIALNVPAASTNPFLSAKTPEAKLLLLRTEAAKLEDAAGARTPAELKAARDELYARYVAGQGTLGLQDRAAAGQPVDNLARRIVDGRPSVDITPANVTQYPLFDFFWATEGQEGMGLARHGLDEVTPDGVKKLVAWAKTHELDGSPKPEGLQRIDADARAVIKAILAHEHYGAFFEVDARPEVYKAFGIEANVAKQLDALRPVKVGNIEIPSVVQGAGALAHLDRSDLADHMKRAYQANKAFFEDPRASEETRGLRTLGLLKDYATALWASGEHEDTEAAGEALLDVFFSLPGASAHGAKDYNGAGWGVAQSLVLGVDANAFETHFPKASGTASTTYLSMHNEMGPAMRFVDDYRALKGLPRAAEAFEGKSPLGWMIGEESGHNKAGNLDEQRPFASSGLNWGVLLFPGDAEVQGLPVKAGFELPMDIIDGFGNAIVAKPAQGDRMIVRDAAGQPLTVEKQIQRDDAGKAVSWSAVFKDAAGKEVAPEGVLGVIANRYGQVKGDGKATRSLDMWWWGFCDRNTAQRLYKSKYGVPELERDVKIVENGKTITVPRAEAQKLVDMDMPDLVPYETMSGFRFNDEPQYVKLKDGSGFEARVKDLALEAGPGTKRVGGDLIAIYDAPGRPMLGTLELEQGFGGTKSIDVRYVESLTKKADGTVVVKMSADWEGGQRELSGKLTTQVPWEKGTKAGGDTVLAQSSDYPIRGGFTFELDDGSTRRVDASEISQIVGETQKDLRISQFMAWVSQNQGMFATDGSTGVVVSNGMRWVNKLEVTQHADDSRPTWAEGKKLRGLQGDLRRVEGDKMLFVQGLYGSGGDPSNDLFAGWVQVDKSGRILNEGFTSGQPDFGWSGYGPLNWLAKSTFNPYMTPELRLKLFVNGVADQTKLEKLAADGNLPANWRDYLTPQN